MKLKFRISSRYILYTASLISITFIVISAFLIIKVGQLEKKVELHSEDIRVLNAIQNSSFDVYAAMVKGEPPKWSALSEAYNKLADQTFPDKELDQLTDMILEIKVIADRRRKVDVEPLKGKLSDLIHYSNELLEENRNTLNSLGMQLDKYWLFTHISLVFACIMSLALIYSTYRSGRSLRALKREKGKNARIFNQALNCIIISDENSRIVEFNKAAEEHFGYKRNEVIGTNFENLYKSNSDLNRLRESFENEGRFIGEILNQRKDGSQFISFLSANQLKDREGKIMGSIGISRDISKEKAKEQEYENILDNATDIILTTDLKGDCTFINDAGRVQLGYQYREMIGKSIREFIYDEDFDTVSAFYKHQFEQKTAETYLEFRVKKKNGDVIWVGQVAKLLRSPSNRDQLIGIQAIVRNIDDRKRAENEIKRREASYRELFENTSELIHNMDEKGHILYCNRSWRERLGYGEDEIAKLNFFDMLSKIHRGDLKALIKVLHEEQSREERSIKFSLNTKGGKTLKMNAVISEALHNDSAPTIQVFMRDTSAEKIAKQAKGNNGENLKLLTESIDDLFYLWNKTEDQYEYVSRSCKSLLGVTATKIKKASDFEDKFLHPQDLLKYQSARKELEKGGHFDLDFRVIVKDEIKWVNEKIFPIEDGEGKVQLHSGVMRDISQAVKSEETIRKQDKEIGQSLSYVHRMQENMLIELNQIKAKLDNLYVFFQPREEISGDFFIAERMTNRSHEDIILLAAADCTGNGMPVGMLSFLCNSLLKESFLSSAVQSPSDALEFVRSRLISLFKFDESEYVTDGMNISLCLINPEKMELEFAGANQPLFLLRNEQIMEIKGSRQHVGYNHKTEPFKNHKVSLKVGDSVYLFTDGFYSQFGGEEGKKLLKRRMMDFLLTISHLGAKEQKKELSKFFDEWKGEREQLDDVTVACFQV